jgi:hypothetical protein
MNNLQRCFWAAAICWIAGSWLGCGPSRPIEINSPPPDSAGDSAHHDHDEELGPHQGHLVHLEPSEFVAEWTHDDEAHKITVYILDPAGRQSVAIAAGHVTIESVVGDKPEEYQLTAVEPNDEDPAKASQFEAVDETLLTTLAVGTGVHARLRFTIGEKTYEGEIEHHEHHGHGHHHHH